VLDEYDHIQQTLTVVSTLRIPEAQEAAGLKTQLLHADFLPVVRVTKELLDMLMPLNTAFQSEQIDVGIGLLQIDALQRSLENIQEDLSSLLDIVSDEPVDELNKPINETTAEMHCTYLEKQRNCLQSVQ